MKRLTAVLTAALITVTVSLPVLAVPEESAQTETSAEASAAQEASAAEASGEAGDQTSNEAGTEASDQTSNEASTEASTEVGAQTSSEQSAEEGSVPAAVVYKEYYLPEADLTLFFPDTMTVITADTDASDPYFAKNRTTKEKVMKEFEKTGRVLTAGTDEAYPYITVDVSETEDTQGIGHLKDCSEDTLKLITDRMLESDIYVGCQRKTRDGVLYLSFDIEYGTDAQKRYGTQEFTIVNGRSVRITYQSDLQPDADPFRQTFAKVMDTAEFKVDAASEASQEQTSAAASLYNNMDIRYIYMIIAAAIGFAALLIMILAGRSYKKTKRAEKASVLEYEADNEDEAVRPEAEAQDDFDGSVDIFSDTSKEKESLRDNMPEPLKPSPMTYDDVISAKGNFTAEDINVTELPTEETEVPVMTTEPEGFTPIEAHPVSEETAYPAYNIENTQEISFVSAETPLPEEDWQNTLTYQEAEADADAVTETAAAELYTPEDESIAQPEADLTVTEDEPEKDEATERKARAAAAKLERAGQKEAVRRAKAERKAARKEERRAEKKAERQAEKETHRAEKAEQKETAGRAPSASAPWDADILTEPAASAGGAAVSAAGAVGTVEAAGAAVAGAVAAGAVKAAAGHRNRQPEETEDFLYDLTKESEPVAAAQPTVMLEDTAPAAQPEAEEDFLYDLTKENEPVAAAQPTVMPEDTAPAAQPEAEDAAEPLSAYERRFGKNRLTEPVKAQPAQAVPQPAAEEKTEPLLPVKEKAAATEKTAPAEEVGSKFEQLFGKSKAVQPSIPTAAPAQSEEAELPVFNQMIDKLKNTSDEVGRDIRKTERTEEGTPLLPSDEPASAENSIYSAPEEAAPKAHGNTIELEISKGADGSLVIGALNEGSGQPMDIEIRDASNFKEEREKEMAAMGLETLHDNEIYNARKIENEENPFVVRAKAEVPVQKSEPGSRFDRLFGSGRHTGTAEAAADKTADAAAEAVSAEAAGTVAVATAASAGAAAVAAVFDRAAASKGKKAMAEKAAAHSEPAPAEGGASAEPTLNKLLPETEEEFFEGVKTPAETAAQPTEEHRPKRDEYSFERDSGIIFEHAANRTPVVPMQTVFTSVPRLESVNAEEYHQQYEEMKKSLPKNHAYAQRFSQSHIPQPFIETPTPITVSSAQEEPAAGEEASGGYEKKFGRGRKNRSKNKNRSDRQQEAPQTDSTQQDGTFEYYTGYEENNSDTMDPFAPGASNEEVLIKDHKKKSNETMGERFKRSFGKLLSNDIPDEED